jgi:hypothetical protein
MNSMLSKTQNVRFCIDQYFNDQIDLDFIVNFDDVQLLDYVDNYFDLKFSLEDTFKSPVD